MGLQYHDGTSFVPIGGGTPPAYTRPADWLTLPTVVSGDKKFYMLVPIYNDGSNVFTMQCAGDYTVDWGDGSATENFAANAVAQRNIAWADISSTTLTSEGFRQAIVSVVPQSGQNLTLLKLNYQSGNDPLPNYLAFRGSSPQLATLQLNNGSRTLREFELIGTNAITNWSSMFQGCRSLEYVGDIDFTTATRVDYMFANCNMLKRVQDTFTLPSALYQVSDMFNQCVSLKTGPSITGANTGNPLRMFSGCSSLETVGDISLPSATSASEMFISCSSLTTVGALNLPAVTNFTYMFYNCKKINAFGTFTTTAATNMSNMFSECNAMRVAPTFTSTTSVTNMSGMFSACYALETVPAYGGSAVTNVDSMFYYCTALQVVPALNWGAVTTASTAFYGCQFIRTVGITGTPVTHSYSGNSMGAAALDAIYTALPTVTAKTITVSTNYGVTADDPTIATAKGWTVTG